MSKSTLSFSCITCRKGCLLSFELLQTGFIGTNSGTYIRIVVKIKCFLKCLSSVEEAELLMPSNEESDSFSVWYTYKVNNLSILLQFYIVQQHGNDTHAVLNSLFIYHVVLSQFSRDNWDLASSCFNKILYCW